ncbi:MAG: hypothetical protein LKJ94_05725 [Candidatus Methanomethylophilus sp.]|jgi:hypothetical protein|nr:hypothetical protein [Methanomethylophilus sp.]MCI2092521.1 hypothetical protein [Methanomethylophilus sp.]
MKIRVMGTEAECAEFAAMIKKNVPPECIRSISRFYPNRRAGEYSSEGRIYLEFERGTAEAGRDHRRPCGTGGAHMTGRRELCSEGAGQ